MPHAPRGPRIPCRVARPTVKFRRHEACSFASSPMLREGRLGNPIPDEAVDPDTGGLVIKCWGRLELTLPREVRQPGTGIAERVRDRHVEGEPARGLLQRA